MDGVKDSITLKSSSLFNWEKRKQLWYTIENLCSCLIHCGDLWEDKSKNFGKRRAFSDLLMLLDSCGLSKHRTSVEVLLYSIYLCCVIYFGFMVGYFLVWISILQFS